MTKLFNLGKQMAIDGYRWHNVPPGYDANNQ